MSIIQDLDFSLRTEIDVVEDYIRLVFVECKSSFTTSDLEPGFYTFKVFSEVLFKNLQPEYDVFNNSIDIEFDEII